ncbi:MAG: HNH endonuclease [Myxococcales bacterium]|nr:HNH endonuclease [Myxococcales bacterium]
MARRRRRRRSRRNKGGLLSGLLLALLLGAIAWAIRALGPTVLVDEPSAGGDAGAGAGPIEAYEREAWPHWSDADGDCQDTRQEVLIAESEIPVQFRTSKHCRVKSGRWRCPYTGKVFTDPAKLDVDHLVPLAEAHRSGGHAWDRAKRERYANALGEPEHLVAVEAGANRAKADKGPEAWMPPAEGHRCAYLEDWLAVKQRWGLALDDDEQAYVTQAQQACGRGEVPALPPGQRR